MFKKTKERIRRRARAFVADIAAEVLKHIVHMLLVDIGIEEWKKMIQEAEKSGDKYKSLGEAYTETTRKRL